MTAPKPRLLACGFCFEEEGEEVHPHPECPVGRVALADQAKYDALVAEADRLRREGAALHARAEGIDRQLAALQQQVAAPVDRAAVLREAAERLSVKAYKLTEGLHDLAHFVAKDRLREAEILDREAAVLRRVADETAATETQAAAWGVCQDCGAAAGPDCDCPPLAEQPAAGAGRAEPATPPCVECSHPKADHGEGEDPVTPGQCRTCPDDDARHDYWAAERQDGAQ